MDGLYIFFLNLPVLIFLSLPHRFDIDQHLISPAVDDCWKAGSARIFCFEFDSGLSIELLPLCLLTVCILFYVPNFHNRKEISLNILIPEVSLDEQTPSLTPLPIFQTFSNSLALLFGRNKRFSSQEVAFPHPHKRKRVYQSPVFMQHI